MTSPKSFGKPRAKKPKAPLAIRRVVGDSMLPTLKPGQLVLVLQWRLRPKVGQIVIIEHQGLLKIKRITKIRDGKIYILGDNPVQSTDSRTLGWLSYNSIQGIVGHRPRKA